MLGTPGKLGGFQDRAFQTVSFAGLARFISDCGLARLNSLMIWSLSSSSDHHFDVSEDGSFDRPRLPERQLVIGMSRNLR